VNRRNARRALAVMSIAAATVLTVRADTAGAGVSCSLRVVDRTADTMTLAYDPHDGHARTVWVDGHPTTIAPHTTAVVRRADSIRYPTQGEVIVVAELVAECGGSTTTSSTTSTTVASTTTTEASSTETTIVHRTTPEPTTTTQPAPLPPATWTVVDPTTTTVVRTPTTLPETGTDSGDLATGGLLTLGVGAVIAAAAGRRRES
jgi:LPXTG-motif cell wall-anchored protein